MITSVAPKARMRKAWSETRRVMNERCRAMGSGVMWFWLARVIRGSSQQDNTNRGVERGSVAAYRFEQVQPTSVSHLSQVRLIAAIASPCVVAVVHSHFLFTSQVVGISMMVGIRTFSIVVDLGL